MKRYRYYLCRYERTEEIKPQGAGFYSGPYAAQINALPLAPVHVYRLKRGAALMLTEEEAGALSEALDVEGCPSLLSEENATEGKPL